MIYGEKMSGNLKELLERLEKADPNASESIVNLIESHIEHVGWANNMISGFTKLVAQFTGMEEYDASDIQPFIFECKTGKAIVDELNDWITERQMGKYKKAKAKPGMTKLIIMHPAGSEGWEPELSFLCADGDGYEGFEAGCSFTSIKECINWAKGEQKKENFNKGNKPDTKLLVEIYVPITKQAIKLR